MKYLMHIAAALVCGVTAAKAAVKMPSIFGDHMVLQQEEKLPVWGMADPGEEITVTVGIRSAKTKAAADGTWRVELPAFPDASAPVTMNVAGKNTLTFHDVLIGDVWLCGGQSNMQIGLGVAHNAAEVIPKAEDPQLRFFDVPLNPKIDPQTDVAGHWEVCSRSTNLGISAVAYFFAREIRAKIKRPIGLLSTSWGGTTAEAWTSLSGLEKEPALKPYIDKYSEKKAKYPQAAAEYAIKQAAYQEALAQWKKEVEPASKAATKDWENATAKAKTDGQSTPSKPMPATPKPTAPPGPEGGWNTPTVLFNGMIAPFTSYPLKGVIWYQGEQNAEKSNLYQPLFAALINDWRQKWHQPELPFLFVQLAGFKGGYHWPVIREAQLKTLTLPKTAMASAVDIGEADNVHPRDKMDVGLRLALAARHVAYRQDIVYSGPIYDTMKVDGKTVRLTFQHIGSGLIIAAPPWSASNSSPASTTALQSFKIAGADKKWFSAEAVIKDDTVLVSSLQVSQPVAVRYAWEEFPTCNFYNREGLPASPFRTDNWD